MSLAEAIFAAMVDRYGIALAPWCAGLDAARSELVATSVDALRLARAPGEADELVGHVSRHLAILHGLRSRSSLRRWQRGCS